MSHTYRLLALLVLFATLAPSPVQAEPAVLEWRAVDKPGKAGNIVVSPSEVSEIAVGGDGVIYALDSSESSKVYRSLSAGLAWEDITTPLAEAGAELPASKVAVAPDEPDTVAVVTNSGTEVYLSTNGGTTWTDTNVPSLVGTIQTIAISSQYSEAGEEFREIAIGTAVWGDDFTSGQVWVIRLGEFLASWRNQDLTIDPAHLGGEVSALAYSPNYYHDTVLLAIASTGSDVDATYQNKTWLCIGERDASAGTTLWNNPTGYPVEIVSAGDATGVDYIYSSLALPSDYSGNEASSRRVFVSYDRKPSVDDDVYLIDDITTYRLNADGGADIEISSITYYGTITSGKLLAGEVNPVAGSLTVQVRRTTNPFDMFPAWYLSSVPPTGPGNAKVSWSPDGEIAYCGTGQDPRVALDESAFSASLDGDKWRQLGLIDTVINLADIAPSPDSESLFITTYDPFGPEGVWRSAGEPLGERWERVLTMDTATDAVILRLSSDYINDYTIYAAEVGGSQIAVSHDRGNSWRWCRIAPGPLVDMVVEDENTIYVALPEGNIRKSTNEGRSWQEAVETTLSDINMLAIAEKEHILVGSRNGEVAYSTDGGASFVRIPEVIGDCTRDVQVVADVNYSENGIIYAATDMPDEGIWRWTIGHSTRWVQIDASITALKGGQRISGLMVGTEGTLYALRMEPATSTSGGMTRSLNPSIPYTIDIEFDFTNYLLPAGTTFDPNAVFPNTLPYLKLSGDAEQNELWSIDTANQIIYHFQDTLCKIGPTQKAPESGAVVPLGSCSCGYVEHLSISWERQCEITVYEAAIYLDSDCTQRVWSVTYDTTKMIITDDDIISVIVTDGANAAQLISGTTYYWRVRSVKPLKSPWSETWSFTPALGGTELSPLAEFATLSPPVGATDVLIRPAFSWNSIKAATGYEFVLAMDSEFSDVVIAKTGEDVLPTAAWICDRNLQYSTTYFWKVRAVSATSYSEWGTAVFTTEAASALPTPSSLPPEPELPLWSPFARVIIITGGALIIVVAVMITRSTR